MSTFDMAALTQSAADFQGIVWPVLSMHPDMGGGELRPVEATASGGFADDLDTLAGIDGWQILRERQAIRGLASRVIWKEPRFRSFTIRCARPTGVPTEFAKRLDAIRNRAEGYLFPHWTVQAYLAGKGGALLSVAAIPTETLILQTEWLRSIGKLGDSADTRFGVQVLPDGTAFYYLSWDYLVHTKAANGLIRIDIG